MSTEQETLGNASTAKGSWKRAPTKFHGTISTEKGSTYTAEKGRYRLYVSLACPWAHRCFITRQLKGLEDVIALTVTHYRMPHISPSKEDQSSEYKGWLFNEEKGQYKDPKSIFFEPHGFTTLSQLYELAHPGYKQEALDADRRPVYSVPVLFDEKTQSIVTNESSEIIVLLNEKFNAFAKNPDLDLNPESLREEMKKVDAIVYPGINDGVYRCGFAKSQDAYEDAYKAHWKAMDKVEAILEKTGKFLTGERLTLSDIRLFVTLIRYDVVYFAHFKTSRNFVRDMPNMLRFLKDVFNQPGVKETVNIEFIVKHYYESQRTINPTGIWPMAVLEKDVLDYLL